MDAGVLQAAVRPLSRDTLYAQAIEFVTGLIQQEMADKALGALSIALVDRGGVVWAIGFGTAQAASHMPATAGTVYRVGSVGKTFTDVAIMRLAEAGVVELDTPVSEYLPDFRPANPWKTRITLRHLMSHYSGLVREPPVGNYFDPSEPSLEETVTSISNTTLVYEPGTRIKYSNAGLAVVGLALEQEMGLPFPKAVDEAVLVPLGMTSSSFAPTPRLTERMADGTMWWVDGREWPAPTFHLGMAPAGTLYSTVEDLARFVWMVLNGGAGPERRILREESLNEMLTPQFNVPSVRCYFDVGIGFDLQTCWEDTFKARHGGGVYGFSTELATLPEEGLGVVVATNRDSHGSVVRHIGEAALRAMLAVKRGEPMPDVELSRRPAATLCADLATFGATSEELSAEAAAGYGSLLGDFGWEHSGVRILEGGGALHVLMEWFTLYPLEAVGADVFKLGRMTAYADEALTFERAVSGEVQALVIGGSARLPRLAAGRQLNCHP